MLGVLFAAFYQYYRNDYHYRDKSRNQNSDNRQRQLVAEEKQTIVKQAQRSCFVYGAFFGFCVFYAFSANKKPVRVDCVRRTGQKRYVVLSAFDVQILDVLGEYNLNLVNLILQRSVEYVNVKAVALLETD